jgi:hypothetical protein
VANSYTAIADEVSEDANFYKQSDLEELILEVSFENRTVCLSNSCMIFTAPAIRSEEKEETKDTSNYQS